MFNPSRQEVRQFFCGIWRKHLSGSVLSPLETMARGWLLQHPEYHTLLANEEAALTQEFPAHEGQINPFLHLSMHLSIAEQVSVDQPCGIRNAYIALAQKLDSEHAAHHRIMDCLGAMLWTAQQNRCEPDGNAYLACIQRQIKV